MATNIFEATRNPRSGETFRCISVTPELYKMQWTLQPNGYVPFEHIHYLQDEIFYVQQGELKVLIDGVEHFAGPGETITVPMGARHLASNNKNEVMEAIVDYSPALDYDTFMQCLCGLTKDGYLDEKSGISIPMMGYCLMKMKCKAMARPTAIPAPAFNMALRFFYLMGTVRGWNRLFKKYTV